jgi:acetyltransferase-like isoleucine patch superfamily enzyme
MEEYLVYQGCDIRGRENIEFGKGCVIQSLVWLDVRKGAKLIIGAGANIGRRCVIGCGKRVEIGEKVLIGPNSYVADVSHEYSNPDISIAEQGIKIGKPITIGKNTWIGMNCAIMADVGRNCVIGFNSVVTKPIPDYSVACGNPARIVKKYSFKHKKWLSVSSPWTRFIIFLKKMIRL